MNIESYKAMRAKGVSARSAFACGQRQSQQSQKQLGLNGVGDVATWEQDGFSLRAEVQADDDADFSFLGEFTRNWAPGAIHHDYLDSMTFDWFVPTSTEDEHFRGLRQMKYGRRAAHELARSYVRQDYKRLREYGVYWWSVGIVVTVSRAGIELGDASVWGIESDSDEGYLTEMALDLVGDALEQARAALERLCGASSEMH